MNNDDFFSANEAIPFPERVLEMQARNPLIRGFITYNEKMMKIPPREVKDTICLLTENFSEKDLNKLKLIHQNYICLHFKDESYPYEFFHECIVLHVGASIQDPYNTYISFRPEVENCIKIRNPDYKPDLYIEV